MPTHRIAEPHRVFEKFRELGDQELVTIRAIVTKPLDTKEPRSWSGAEAAELIGKPKQLAKAGFDPAARYTLAQINEWRERVGTLYRRPAGSSPLVSVVINFKGGVGKSTTCIHLSQYLAIQGLRVLVVDLDPQASTTLNLTNLMPDVELEYEHIINEALLTEPSQFKYLIRETYFTNVYIVPTNLYLQDLDLTLPNPTLNNEATLGIPAGARLEAALATIKDDFDVILLDCPPNLGSVTTNAVVAANSMLIPLSPFAFDRASFVMLSNSLERLFESTQRPLDYLRIVITRHPDSKAANLQEERIRALYGDYVLENPMYMATEIEKATTMMSSIYDLQKPTDNRATYLRALNITNAVNAEIFAGFIQVWEEQANG